jgi:large subunit ribosomal protein L7e
VKKAQDYENEYASAARKAVTETRKAKAAGGFYVPAEAKLILVTRIRGVTCLSP